MCLLRRARANASGCGAALLSHGWTWHPYARPRPRFGSYAPILKQVLLLLVEIMNLLSKCGLLRSVIQAPQNIGSFTKTWVGKQNMSTSSLISCPMVSGKTPVLSIKITGRGLGWEIKLSTTPIGQGKAAEHAGNFMYNRTSG